MERQMMWLDPAPPRWLHSPLVYLPRRIFNEAFLEALVSGEVDFPLRRKVIISDLIGTSDYLGLNFYQRYRVSFAPLSPGTFFLQQRPDPESPKPPPLWGEIYPQGIYGIIRHVYKLTRLPIYITESGTPDTGDEIRRWYIARMVQGIWHAINFNVPVKGLYYWTLTDSFEWTAGYNPLFRFGLYEMNFQTQERTRRISADFYAEICAAKGMDADMVRRYTPQLEKQLFAGETPETSVHLPARTV